MTLFADTPNALPEEEADQALRRRNIIYEQQGFFFRLCVL